MVNFWHTAQKTKISSKNFFSKCDQIHSFIWISSNLLKKSSIEIHFLCIDMIKNTIIVKKINQSTYSYNLYRQAHMWVLHSLKIGWLWRKFQKNRKLKMFFLHSLCMNEMLSAIWYQLYSLKSVKNTHATFS